MKRLIGEVDIYPWLTVTVETQAGRRTIRCLIDTAFDGGMAIPRSYTSWFGVSEYFTEALFADGIIADSMTVQCRIDWIDGWTNVSAMYIDGPNPLLGMDLFDNCVVSFEKINGRGEIIVEPVE